MKTPYNKSKILIDGHWERECFSQRMTTRCWKLLLLNNDDNVIFEGKVRQLVAKRIGYGVVEVSKQA